MIRTPAVAGFFYEGEAGPLRRNVEGSLAAARPPKRALGEWSALLLPHAGHVYSGPVAGAGVGAVEWPDRAILLGPNHRGVGSAAALSRAAAWRTPLGDVLLDPALADALEEACPSLERDERAHAGEHALEVIIPFLQVVRPDVRIACISLGEARLGLCREIGAGVARVTADAAARGERIAIVVSSDLSHYLPRAENRAQDDRALDALLEGSPEELFARVLEKERITMCGILPATALLFALRALGGARGTLLSHGDSADFSGDESRVVGYASVVWDAPRKAA
jgi:hypothetical protein